MGLIEYHALHDVVRLIGTSVITVVPLFIYRRQKAFGHWIALLTLSLIALISTIAQGELVSYLGYLLYLLCMIFNLNAANLLSIGGQTALNQNLAKGYFKQLLPSLGLGLLGGALIFVFFPRSHNINNPLGLRQKSAETGYTGKITLDGGHPIAESSAMALIVESEDIGWLALNAGSLYFRGNSLETFDGIHWSSAPYPTYEFHTSANTKYTSVVQNRSSRAQALPRASLDESHSLSGIAPGARSALETSRRSPI